MNKVESPAQVCVCVKHLFTIKSLSYIKSPAPISGLVRSFLRVQLVAQSSRREVTTEVCLALYTLVVFGFGLHVLYAFAIALPLALA